MLLRANCDATILASMLTRQHFKPRIGVPFRTADEENAGPAKLHKIANYYRAIEEAGGEPVAVSLQLSLSQRERLLETMEGYVLPGSPADVDSSCYGAARHPAAAQPDKRREETDFA